ncbi:MAG: hypothetical protein ACOZQL_34770 [Myxococcota bacterium]
MANEEKVSAALAVLAIAEQELQLALSQLQVLERADKQMVDVVVQGALQKVMLARRTLDQARQ